MTKNEHPSMIIEQELFDELINAQIALFKQIEAKQRIDGAVITKEEANFANTFIKYAHALNKIIDEQL